jgi:hypothetical protein
LSLVAVPQPRFAGRDDGPLLVLVAASGVGVSNGPFETVSMA